MMKRLIIVFAIAALPLAAQADDGQTVTVGGVTVNKTVKEITFNGSDVQLSYTDGTTQSADMATVNIAFGSTSGIKTVNQNRRQFVDDRIYNLSGQYVGKDEDKLPEGIYIINGKKQMIKR